MKKHLWKVMGLVALLALLVGAVPLAAEEAEPAGPINSLRVYSKPGVARFDPNDRDWWYNTPTGPFDLTSGEAPEKDFVVFNPAVLLDGLDPLGLFVKAGRDVAEKVHTRMWYDPTRPEPIGDTYPEVDAPDRFADIVFDYTYMFVSELTGEPTMGKSFAMGQVTQMAFPMAGLHGPLGLDRYDIGPNNDAQPMGDGNPEVMRLEAITRGFGDVTTDSTIVVSPQPTAGAIRLHKGDWIEFFDYAVKVIDEPTTQDLKVEVAIYYIGYKKDEPYYVGSTNLWLYDKAAVDARFGPVRESWSQEFWRTPEPVKRPFWVEATHVGTDYVILKPYRYLQTGETFFVDGAEYDVAAIYTAGKDCNQDCWSGNDWDPKGCDRWLKYITLQSPLPKGNGRDLYIKDISVYKRTVRANTSLPMLPPFNMVHDEIDDTNIPDCYYPGPDDQLPDNLDISPCRGPDFLDPDFDTLGERLMLDTPPYDGMAGDPYSYIAWIAQTKEPRFDTNLTEEKWLELCERPAVAGGGGDVPECEEVWQWINIETRPWYYTEFILPMRPDITDPAWEDGDYILVGSWLTEDSEPRRPIRFKFVYDAAVGLIHSADVYVNDAEYNMEFFGVDANSLRVYGHKADEGAMNPFYDAAFPYTDFMGPFDLTSPEAPEKDFVVHNPALLNHFDGGLFGRIKADEDAHEKVFLRTWYVPDYPEPRGWIWDFEPRPKFTNPLGEIVNEYTYMFIDDTTLDPTHGSYDRTDIVFPMAGLGGQVGLDRYDVNGDGTDEIMSVEYIRQGQREPSVCEPFEPTTMGNIVVAPQAIDAGNMKLVEGGQIEFFDYMIKLIGTSTSELKADLEVWYTGQGYNDPLFIDNITLWQEVANAAVVDAGQWDVNVSYDRHFDTIPLESIWPGEGMVPVDRPFGILVTYVGEDYVSLTPYRILQTGETIWVDGAEYDVAAIGIVPGDQPAAHFDCDLAELKYITIRNPLPKGTGSIYLPEYTVWKARFGRQQPLPVLPPFNMMHDMVDDVNIPDCFSGIPDQQWEDNYNGGVAPCGPPDYLHNSYDFIAERIVEDQKPLVFWWFREEKEPRFDTNLTEEKFTEWEDWKEKWMWINIETMPWHFTEFVLPEWPEAPGLENLGYIGDYILVSSFITEDGVRVKFSYDASDGTGLYVNSDLCEPARVLDVTSNSVVQQYADVMLKGVVENADTFAWDFGGLTGCTGADTLTPTCSGDVAGAFEVTLTVKNECAEHTLATIVVVEPCPGDFAAPFGFRDLADIMAMLPAWNSDLGDAEYDEMFDFDDDGHVGLYDIMQVVAVWNTECPGGMP